MAAPYLFCVEFVYMELSASVCLHPCEGLGSLCVSSILSQFGSVSLSQGGYRLACL